VFARHPDLVAVHASPSGCLALVLRHTIVPLPEEHAQWRQETGTAARRVIDDLRGAGFEGRCLTAQWLPVNRLGEVLERWPARWEGDPVRAAHLRTVVRRLLDDRRFLAWRRAARSHAPAESGEPTAIRRWYCHMAPVWLAIEPERRRKLVLQTHVWIVERALGGDAWPPPSADLVPDGALAHRLERLVADDERPLWDPWIGAVIADLAWQLRTPPRRRDARWMRRLFMTACRVPSPVAHRATVSAL